LTFRYYKGGRSSAIRTGRLYPNRNPRYSLSETDSTSGHVVLSGVKSSKGVPRHAEFGLVYLYSIKFIKLLDQLSYNEFLRRNSLIPYVEEKFPPDISERKNLL
jgi:hypothetical protein